MGKGVRKTQSEGSSRGAIERREETQNSGKLRTLTQLLPAELKRGRGRSVVVTVVCADALLLISYGSLSFYTMEEQQEPRTIELNDGRKMPLLGLGTWKVPSCLVPRLWCCFHTIIVFIIVFSSCPESPLKSPLENTTDWIMNRCHPV